MIVSKLFGVSLGTGSVAELNIGEFLCSLDHEVLVTERVSEDEIATVVNKLASGIVALGAFGDIDLHNDLICGKTESSACCICSIDEVLVIGGVLVMQEDEANFEIGISIAARSEREGDRKEHKNCEDKRQCLFHGFPP